MNHSYITNKGCLVFHYDPILDNYEEAEKAALIKHGKDNAKITTIAVTPRTDFLKRKKKGIYSMNQVEPLASYIIISVSYEAF